jgi:uncharacterized membrane protein
MARSETPSDRPHGAKGSKSTEELLNVGEAVAAHRTRAASLIESTGRVLANPVFLLSLLAAHLLWVALNLPLVPWEPWDPYPFVFLATVASVEAPFLALLVLMHQQRQERIDELRNELSLQVSLQVEREATVVLRVLHAIQQKLDVEVPDVDADVMADLEEDLDPRALMENLRRHLHEVESDEGPTEP